jgi:excisionase family DNA binding protein
MQLAPASDPRAASAWLSTPEAGELAGVGAAQVRYWINCGFLPGTRVGASWRVRPEDLTAFMESTGRPYQFTGRRNPDGPAAIWHTLAVLCEVGTASAAELAVAVDRDEGNVRKYLALLRHRGLAVEVATRRGQYAATAEGHSEAAERTAMARAS